MVAGAARSRGARVSNVRPPLALAALLAAMSMLSPFSIDTFFPSFRAMQTEFGVNALAMQQTLTFYLLPYALMSLVHGPLSDALGRRRVVLLGLAAYSIASLACALANNLSSLLLFRAAQGITAGAGMAVSRAVVRDTYDGPQALRLMSMITMIFTIAPAVAPIIGGWLHLGFGWRSVFIFMALFGAVLWIATGWRLNETLPAARRLPFRVPALARASWAVASHREFQWLALASAANFSAVMIVVGSAPMIVFDHWGLREDQFANLFLPLVMGMAFGSYLSGRNAGRIAPAQQIQRGIVWGLVASALLMSAFSIVPALPVWPQQLAIALLACGVQQCSPAFSLRMLDLFPNTLGSAASMQSFVSLLASATVMGLVAPLLGVRMQWLAFWMFGVIALSWLLWRRAEKLVKR